MAEAIVFAVVEQLKSTISLGIGVKRSSLIQEELRKLTIKFDAIQVVLAVAEVRQTRESAVRSWLLKLKNWLSDIEDALSEWKAASREVQLKEANKGVSTFLQKVSSLTSPLCFCSREDHQLHRIAGWFKNLNNRLDAISKEKEYFSLTVDAREIPWRPITFSLVDSSMVHGREHDKNELVDLLLSKNCLESSISTISIVGIAGIGKTTLAQLAYNEVSTHFDAKIWLCVTNGFDEISIAKAILEFLGKREDSVELENALQLMHQFIMGKKFLIVLDNVWIKDPKEWERLKNSLSCGSQASRILVTTRNESTAEALGSTYTISLRRLSDEDCLSIFRDAWEMTRGEHEKLEYTDGSEIASKCSGVPHVVKTLGKLVRSKTDIEERKRILGSELWELEEISEDIFLPLLYLYHYLPYKLKKCFLYCAIFPKDYYITKDKLIKLWMAQGYLEEDEQEELESVGKNYFNDLANRSFFPHIEKSEYDDSIIRCKMGDMVHVLAKFLVKGEFTSMKVGDLGNSKLNYDVKGARHLMIIGDLNPISIYNEKKLLSLVLESTKFDPKTGVELSFDHLTCLRTLDLNGCPIEEMQGINKMVQLRYLNLSHNVKIEELPETICELCNLQTLDVSNCCRLQKLPQGIRKLTSLRSLRNYGTSLSYIPKGIEELTNLRELSKFVINNVDNACKLECLEKLEHLGGFLMITGLENLSGSEINFVTEGSFAKKENIFGLGLMYDRLKFAKWEFKDLRLPRNLEELMIKYYKGQSMPITWNLALTKLRVLKLSSCFNFEVLPALGELLSLESLYIWNMVGVKKVGLEFLRKEIDKPSFSGCIAFPKLKYLKIWNMEEWENWDYDIKNDENITIMPVLCSLKLQSCPKLKELPSHFFEKPIREKPEINDCPILEERLKKEGDTNSHIRPPHDKKESEDSWPTVSRISEFPVRNDAESSNSKGHVRSEIEVVSE